MAYTPVNWNTTTTYINPSNLYTMEQGIINNDANIGDLSTLETTEKSNLVGAINELTTNSNKKNYMQLTTNLNSSLSAGFEVVLNTYGERYGDKLIFEPWGVKIGAGISKIKVSASTFVEGHSASGYVWIRISKNGVGVATAIGEPKGGFYSGIVPSSIIPVSEGDKITLVVDTTSGTIRSGNQNTWLLVEEV